MNICIYLIGKGYYIWRNKTRDKKWNAMSPEVNFCTYSGSTMSLTTLTQERAHYFATTTDTGSKRLDVRFWH